MHNQRMNARNCNEFRSSPNVLMSGTNPQIIGSNIQPVVTPPPLPPRRPTFNNQYMGHLGTNYGGYGFGTGLNYRGYGGYGSFGGYNSFGGYGSYPYGSFYNSAFGGPSGDVENRLVQFAEESTRPAFQSIEAMVHTFSSVTMMLESTFFAMTSSFRAILSVAENMGRLRTMFSQLLSTFALIRFFKWLYLKTKYLLGLRSQDPINESLWRQTLSEVINGDKETPSTWPILTFLGLLFATPYLIHKLINSANKSVIDVNDVKGWFKCKEPVLSAVAMYDFIAASKEELSLKTGQKVLIAPRSLQPKHLPGWWRASNTVEVGLIPSNYVTNVTTIKKEVDNSKLKSEEYHQATLPDISSIANSKENTVPGDTQQIHGFQKIYEESEKMDNEKT